jgi:hypothetical protein
LSAIKLLALFGKCYFFVGIKISKNIHNPQTGIKKRHELSVIKPLLKHLNINLETVTNSERPDFIIMHENRKIGLELVELAPSSKFAHKQNKNSKGPSITAISLQKIKEAKKEYEKILAARNVLKIASESGCLDS